MSLPQFKRNFGGAIYLASWLKENYANISTTVRAQVSPNFVDCVTAITNKKIEFHFVPELTSTSICSQSPQFSRILIPHSFNLCHRRFALCKELCHVLTDDASVKAKNPSEQLSLARYCSEVVRNSNPKFFAVDLNSEDFCFLLAMELMLPTSKRNQILENMGKGETAYDIAFSLQLPESLINFYRISEYNTFYQFQLLMFRSGGIIPNK